MHVTLLLFGRHASHREAPQLPREAVVTRANRLAIPLAGPAVGLGLLLLLLLVCSARAAFDAYLLLPGIPGEVTETNHLNWIQVLAFDQSQTHPEAAGSPRFSDLRFEKRVDKASPLLMAACASGQSSSSAQLQLLQSEGRRLVFYDIKLSNVRVTALAFRHTPTGATPMEQFSLRFTDVTWTYTAFAQSGLPGDVVQAFWDLQRNKGGGDITPEFRITGIQTAGGDVTVSWNGLAGKTYKLFASPKAQGPYSFVAQRNVTSDGPASLTISSPTSIQFYWMERSP
jgi:type VI secretion system secreted protein Hcp